MTKGTLPWLALLALCICVALATGSSGDNGITASVSALNESLMFNVVNGNTALNASDSFACGDGCVKTEYLGVDYDVRDRSNNETILSGLTGISDFTKIRPHQNISVTLINVDDLIYRENIAVTARLIRDTGICVGGHDSDHCYIDSENRMTLVQATANFKNHITVVPFFIKRPALAGFSVQNAKSGSGEVKPPQSGGLTSKCGSVKDQGSKIILAVPVPLSLSARPLTNRDFPKPCPRRARLRSWDLPRS